MEYHIAALTYSSLNWQLEYNESQICRWHHSYSYISTDVTRNLSVDEIGKRYCLNYAIIEQAACQTVVCRMM